MAAPFQIMYRVAGEHGMRSKTFGDRERAEKFARELGEGARMIELGRGPVAVRVASTSSTYTKAMAREKVPVTAPRVPPKQTPRSTSEARAALEALRRPAPLAPGKETLDLYMRWFRGETLAEHLRREYPKGV